MSVDVDVLLSCVEIKLNVTLFELNSCVIHRFPRISNVIDTNLVRLSIIQTWGLIYRTVPKDGHLV